MGTKLNPTHSDCYSRALDDEPMFTLLARDPSAPHMVRQWAYERERAIKAGEAPESDYKIVAEARECAKQMQRWRSDNEEEKPWRKGVTMATPAYVPGKAPSI